MKIFYPCSKWVWDERNTSERAEEKKSSMKLRKKDTTIEKRTFLVHQAQIVSMSVMPTHICYNIHMNAHNILSNTHEHNNSIKNTHTPNAIIITIFFCFVLWFKSTFSEKLINVTCMLTTKTSKSQVITTTYTRGKKRGKRATNATKTSQQNDLCSDWMKSGQIAKHCFPTKLGGNAFQNNSSFDWIFSSLQCNWFGSTRSEWMKSDQNRIESELIYLTLSRTYREVRDNLLVFDLNSI